MEWFNLYCMVVFIDDPVPLSTIGGTGDVDNIDTEEDNNIVHETGILLYPLPEILVNRACVCLLQLCLDTILACND